MTNFILQMFQQYQNNLNQLNKLKSLYVIITKILVPSPINYMVLVGLVYFSEPQVFCCKIDYNYYWAGLIDN